MHRAMALAWLGVQFPMLTARESGGVGVRVGNPKTSGAGMVVVDVLVLRRR